MKKIQTERLTGLTDNPWSSLRRYTDARIGLGRTGVSQPTQAQLAFQLAHARARDAVHLPLNMTVLHQQLSAQQVSFIQLHSQAMDRSQYLQRPDIARKLNLVSSNLLKAYVGDGLVYDATVVLADGLSSTAVQQHGALVAGLIMKELTHLGLTCAPLCLVEQGRVAIGDEIAEILGTRLLILLIGERPGLSSPDSLGLYYTYQPRVGLTDEARNCISNIRPAGLIPNAAVKRLMWIIAESERLKLSGVRLKDRSTTQSQAINAQQNFLLE